MTDSPDTVPILHVITTAAGGGAETALARLVRAEPNFTHHVVALAAGNLTDIAAAGARVHTLGLRRGQLTPAALLRLAAIVRGVRPVVVQTWMYHADLIGGAVTRAVSRVPVVWGLRNAYLDTDATRTTTRAVARVCAALSSRLPRLIVSNSEYGADSHIAMGYAAHRMRVVPNGYDCEQIARDETKRVALRKAWSVADNIVLFGAVGRWDAQKDYGNLIAALRALDTKDSGWHCVLVGAGLGPDNPYLTELVRAAGLHEHVTLCGPRRDIPSVMSALDVLVLPSRGEAFPNVVAEAMCCGTPGVVTDVGDAARIVGDTGWVVPPRQPVALAEVMKQAAADTRQPEHRSARSAAARARIEQHFSIDRMVGGYHAVWSEARNSASRTIGT